MPIVTRRIDAPPDAVYAVLADPHTYDDWVVGARRVRRADGEWPQPGATLYHEVGLWPLRLRDSTSVRESDHGRRLVLEARARPIGIACIVIELSALDAGTLVTMEETVTLPRTLRLAQPLLAPLVRLRNREVLRRLADLTDAWVRAGAA